MHPPGRRGSEASARSGGVFSAPVRSACSAIAGGRRALIDVDRTRRKVMGPSWMNTFRTCPEPNWLVCGEEARRHALIHVKAGREPEA